MCRLFQQEAVTSGQLAVTGEKERKGGREKVGERGKVRVRDGESQLAKDLLYKMTIELTFEGFDQHHFTKSKMSECAIFSNKISTHLGGSR